MTSIRVVAGVLSPAVLADMPPDVYSNAHFGRQLDTSDEWIRSRMGIAECHFASSSGTSDLPRGGCCSVGQIG